jgi:cytochrome c biogenesis protein CcmG/thiol:disulfide interchange protein DsbE
VNDDSESMPADHELPTARDTSQASEHRTWRSPGLRRRIAIAGLVVLVAVVSVAIWQAKSNSPTDSLSPLVGRTRQVAPAFSLTSLSKPGQSLSLGAFRGRPLVINFWASWCIPCRTEMPLLQQAYRGERGKIQFLGIDANDTTNGARAFLNQVHVTYPTVSDANGRIAIQYGLFGLPTTVFISASGRVVGRYIGQLHAATLRAALKEAFHA